MNLLKISKALADGTRYKILKTLMANGEISCGELEDHFTSRSTTPSAVYIKRCAMFKENPPDKDWDGIWTMLTK